MKIKLLVSAIFLLTCAKTVSADNMSSDSYYLQFGTFNMTSGTKTSGSYQVTDTVGQTGPGFYGGSGQDVKSGFQYIYPFASPSPSPSAAPTPSPTPAPELPPVLETLTSLLEAAGLLTPLVTTELARIIEETAPIVAATLPILVTALATAQAIASLLPLLIEFLSRLLQSIGLIPLKRPRGVVFDTKIGKGIAFATISFIRVADNQIVDTVVSDVHGVYRSIKLPPDIYRIEAVHGDYIFPTKLSPRFTLNPHDFYRGESFEITSSRQEEIFLIPMDPIFEETAKSQPLSFYLQLFLQIMRRLVHSLFYPMVVFSVIVTLIFPTILNIAIVVLYAFMFIYRLRHTKRQPLLIGLVVDRYGRPLENVIVRCIETQTNRVSALVITDRDGNFNITLPPLQYTLVVNKDGYVVEQPSKDYSNVFITHTGKEGLITVHMMTAGEAFPDK